MDRRRITQLRSLAHLSRQHREKVVITPDDLDALLDLALAQIEDAR